MRASVRDLLELNRLLIDAIIVINFKLFKIVLIKIQPSYSFKYLWPYCKISIVLK